MGDAMSLCKKRCVIAAASLLSPGVFISPNWLVFEERNRERDGERETEREREREREREEGK